MRKLSTSFSFPGFASRPTNYATLTMTSLLLSNGITIRLVFLCA